MKRLRGVSPRLIGEQESGVYDDPGRRSPKIATRPPSLALPWATLLRPLRGLEAFFIGDGEPNWPTANFHEWPAWP
jgi:hypothetical protein